MNTIRVGEIRLVSFDQHSTRHVLVREVYDTHCVAMLLHPYLELATASDFLLTREATGLSYQLVAQTDIVGCLRESQFVASPLDSNIKVLATVSLDFIRIGNECGSALAGILDYRWSFKRAEGRQWQQITSYTNALLLAIAQEGGE